ncbi:MULTISPECIES: hypothetical protein [Rhodococcus]|uniref:hypothetical protein n=1 Tax=Rhodococcus TaxID=1827 RepID=UPI0002D6222A|nr:MULTISPECIES: hypothetical protein [Rhodococcus]
MAARTGIGDLGRAIAGTLMFAVIYLAIGALVGAVVRNPVNGTSSSCSSGFWTCSSAPPWDPPIASKPGGSRRIS